MPGRGTPWREGGLKDDTVTEADLTPTLRSKVNEGLWKLVATDAVSGTGDTLEVDNIPDSPFIKFFYRAVPTTTTSVGLTFNDDSGFNYVYRTADDDGIVANQVTQPVINLSFSGNQENEFFEGIITNVTGQEKLVNVEAIGDQATSGVGTAPQYRNILGKWTGTASISKISMDSGNTNNLANGSQLSVYIIDSA